jgi:hypothetical protein
LTVASQNRANNDAVVAAFAAGDAASAIRRCAIEAGACQYNMLYRGAKHSIQFDWFYVKCTRF